MPFRSLFPAPIRYYLNDFEFAVTFDPESDPATRKVVGLPIDGLRTGNYARDIAPEMRTKESYCPFRADIWQMGSLFKDHFEVRVSFYAVCFGTKLCSLLSISAIYANLWWI